MRFPRAAFAVFLILTGSGLRAGTAAIELVHVDAEGVIRWNADEREVALFGANYCLPSSGDYRAAGYVHADRKRTIEQDMAHFARMGWDGLRLALWGDWENCDREGNLIVNEHLDLLDYLIFQARQRGIFMLFTPIHRHSALWPDGKDSDAVQGFSKFYPPIELGRNPAAIAAQQKYLRQVLAHVNPYTGLALKDEPAIVFLELINEPEHHADDFAGSVAYINALADAVRSTGCTKILFYNLSQDFRMARAIAASKAQGFSFGWYPTGLGARHTLQGNYLRWVDEYTPLLQPDVPRQPRIVYEFDSADMVSGYMYPAMVRGFRQTGAQFAAMFAYDMLPTAPYNLGWQTHYLNLVYSPRKAVSSIIAAEAMRTLPRGQSYGPYPDNCRFGPFRVSYEEDTSELVTAEQFLYANDTTTVPSSPGTLRRVVGCGRSPLVDYEGNGTYFIERLRPGVWRLEVYPDAVFVQDPFAQRLNYRTISSRLLWHAWPMTIRLPDLGEEFSVTPLNAGNATAPARASGGKFIVSPGVQVLSREGPVALGDLPARVGQVGLDEFVCPPPPDLPIQVLNHTPAEASAERALTFDFDVVGPAAPTAVILHLKSPGPYDETSIPLQPAGAYRYRATLPRGKLARAQLMYTVSVGTGEASTTYPTAPAPAWTVKSVAPHAPITLFAGAEDATKVVTLRHRDWQHAAVLEPQSADRGAPAHLRVRCNDFAAAPRCAFALPIKARLGARAEEAADARALVLTVQGAGTRLHVTLVEADGAAWGRTVSVPTQWSQVVVPLSDLQPESALKLPLGYPGDWNLDLPPPAKRGSGDRTLNGRACEQLQFRVLAAESGPSVKEARVDLATVQFAFD